MSRLRTSVQGIWAVAAMALLVTGCAPDPEPVVTGLTIDLAPCLIGEAPAGDGGVAVASTCRTNLDQAVASGTVNTCLVARGEDGAVRRVPMNWDGRSLSEPLGGELGLGRGERFDAALFFLAESDETGAICDAYAPDRACADDARCVLKLSERGATLAADGSTLIDFTDGAGRCVSENGPPFASEGGTAERCDGMDNDCDRRIDEGFDLDAPCEVFSGQLDAQTAPAECRSAGVTVCDPAGDGVRCGATPTALSSERCEDGVGFDDDCDGRVDENLPCFACADDAACAGHPDGGQCVAGRCVACDPFDAAFPGCGEDALCCESGPAIVCIDGDLDACTACQRGGCDPDAADGCVGRACACGDAPACGDATPFCVGSACVQCREALGHADCGPDALCCGGVCIPTGAEPGQSCIGCQSGCDQLATDRCDDRSCLCGAELACAVPTPVCDPAAPGSCVECIANAQCADAAGRPVCDIGRRICVPCLGDGQCGDPRPECVDAACVQCDADDAGPGYRCAEDGDTPICEGGACRACAAHADCAGRPGDLDYCVDGQCRPCDPDGDLGCDDPTTPICDPGEQICRGCDDAGECNQNLAPASAVLQCAPDGRCVGCVPQPAGGPPNLGCVPDGGRPICDAGDELCRPCAGDVECPAQAPFDDGVDGGVFEAASICFGGRCRMCRPGADDAPQTGCRPEGPTPICVAGDCAPCAADAQCAAVPGAEPICVGGDCRACDPDDDRGCDDLNFPVCDGETFTCRACSENGECPAAPDGRPGLCVEGVCTGCDPESNGGCDNTTGIPICADDDGDGLSACRACFDDGECVGVAGAGPDPDRGECVEGRCQSCDPVDNAACDVAGAAPFCGRSPDGAFRCRPCGADGECAFVAPDTPQCVAGNCRICDPVGEGAFDDVGCAAPTAICDVGTFTCRGCDADDECADGTLCRPDGTCAPCIPETQAGCDPLGRAPVCDADAATCRGCAADAECAGNPQGELCVEGICQPCDADDNRGCGLEALCCGDGIPSCEPTTLDSCAGCGIACGGANDCVDRQCVCGDGPACAGVAPYCEGDAPDGACVACFTDDDCTIPGYDQCVLGVCTACDPRIGEGAAGCAPDAGRPYCEPEISACLSCAGDDGRCTEHAGRPECVDDSCYACDPDDPASPTGQVGCDTASDAPYCDPALNACAGCGGEDDRCVDGARTQCVDESCFACDPRVLQGYAGCDPATDAPFCEPETSTCRACTVDRECDESPGGAECVGDFCRVCDPSDYAGCGLDALCCDDGIPGCRPTDFAVECETCGVPCDARIADTCADRACQCGDAPACEGDLLCVDSVCVECDIDADCNGDDICVSNACVQCDPADNRGCIADGIAPVCGADAACRTCGDNAECGENPNGAVCLSDGSCRDCDPDDHDGCGLDALCCADGDRPACQPTDPGEQCEACDIACDPLAADTCTERGCACGADPVCDGATPFCDAGGCVECRDDADCGGGTLCVDNACVECDPADSRGCDADGIAPICGNDATCRTCDDNAECAGNPSGEVCVADGSCRVCDTDDQDGCEPDSLCCIDGDRPACQPTDPGEQCEACGIACDPLAADTCTERGCACGADPVCDGATPFCDRGGCVECRDDADCGDGTICVDNACVECDPADSRGCDADGIAPICGNDATCRTCDDNAECAGNPSGEVCVADGSCRVCDTDDQDGCEPDSLCCIDGDRPACQPTDPGEQCEACGIACDPVTADTCTERGCACGADPVCDGATPFCDGGGCVECRDDADCGDGTICVDNACVECDPADSRGCDADGIAPICGNDATCRTCDDNAECAGNPSGEVCVADGSCRVCDTDDQDGCEPDSLCCVDGDRPACQPTDPGEQCEACDIACDPLAADTCTERGCACGADPVCDGATPFCDAGGCVECRDDADCGDGTICVDNACVECDPADSRGCDEAGDSPLCQPDNTCGACADDASCADNPNGTSCLLSGSCRACNPLGHGGCGADELCCDVGGEPGCIPTDAQAQCEACETACDADRADTCNDRGCGCGADPACDDAGDQPYCVDGACAACRADEECAGNPSGEVCVDNACVECREEADCGEPGQLFCVDNACVPCSDDADCPDGGFCVAEVCGACDPADNNGCDPAGVAPVCGDGLTCEGCADDAACAGNLNGDQCLPSGECRACDPDDNSGCDANSDTPICDPADFSCGGCQDNADCAGNASGEVCLPSGACRVCDVADHDGCPADELCCDAGGKPECQPTDPDTQCEGCGVACGDESNRCEDRACRCGNNPPCPDGDACGLGFCF